MSQLLQNVTMLRFAQEVLIVLGENPDQLNRCQQSGKILGQTLVGDLATQSHSDSLLNVSCYSFSGRVTSWHIENGNDQRFHISVVQHFNAIDWILVEEFGKSISELGLKYTKADS